MDFSDVAANVLRQAQSLAQAFKSHVTVLHGIPIKSEVVDFTLGSTELPRELTPEEIQADLVRLQRLTEPLRECVADVSLKQFYDATVANITEEALRIGPDLIIVGSHHHNSFYNLLVGSVTNSVLSRAKCPVLVVNTY